MKNFISISAVIFSAAFFPACSSPENSAAPASSEESPRQEKLLSRHDTNAVFAGTREYRCLGMTALCPDKCGSSGTLAVFNTENYNAYEKTDEYGDPRADEFVFMLESTTGTSDVSPEIAREVRAMKAGDKAHLVWEHVYVTDENGSQYPRRIVRVFTREK